MSTTDVATAQPLASVETPLADDLRFLSLRASAELGRMPRCELTLVSKRADIDFSKILGKHVKVSLRVDGAKPRVFGGYVVSFRQTGMRGRLYAYEAAVRPWLWLLTRRSTCRIFQNKTVEEIVKAVFADPVYKQLELGEIKWKANSRAHRPREYCVQYRESDFNFVSRLLEDEGIYYWFQDKDGKESLIITDTLAAHESVAGCESLPYGAVMSAAPGMEYVSEWRVNHMIETRNWVLTDYDFKHPSRPLQKQAVKQMPGFDAFSGLEHFDYPGGYVEADHGESRAKSRADEGLVEASVTDDPAINWHQVDARSNGRSVRAGTLLKLTRHPRADQNAQYLVTRTNYEIDLADYEAFDGAQSNRCECWFSAIDAKQHFTPARVTRRPFVQGPQTAVVVGPGGDEIHTDQYGRVKVQFFWDRQGKRDENSSCWIRVSQPWAGKGFGAVAIPRMGQEVIVDFLEGDPDRPIITGRVYNAEQMPPYDLPGNMTQTGIKSRSSKGGSAANCNELRFEDKKGAEQVLLHAERNQDIEVEKDETHWVGHDRKKNIDHDETTVVKHDRTETVGNNEKIDVTMNRTETVGVNESITIGANRTKTVKASETATVLLQRTHSVGINETITVGAAQEVTIGAFQAVTVGAYQAVTVGAYHTETVGASQTVSVGSSQSVTVGSDQTVNVGGKQATTVGGDQSLSVSGGQTVSVAKDASESIDGAQASKVGKGRTTEVGEDDALKVGKNLVIEAEESVVIKTGDASFSMKKDGTIQIKGKDITVIGSGKINVKADGDITMKGSKILQN
ncbi:type VI secretion system Vgr family protein [Caballeronia novacaledonica]|uniref:Type VI secretion system tip protein VgrG n=1 Tax=Caballeronia novacaledonica TaxID=1544861 RepID=A0AA37IIN7_9BURK|nr:type VI secretion system tip protein TssI/VgrG [Caballeronia novacaledonica]GJH27476.1 type VI secretion system tip protein VgrG [Caballeronia novacaledonica]